MPRVAFKVVAEGLSEFTSNGRPLLTQSENGLLRIIYGPRFRRTNASAYVVEGETPEYADMYSSRKKVWLTYRWGEISCVYSLGKPNQLKLSIVIHNSTPDTLEHISLRVLQLTFPNPPQTTELDAGQFGMGGKMRNLDTAPLEANSRIAPPVCLLDYGSGSMAYCNDSSVSPALLRFPWSSNSPANTQYPLWVTADNGIAPHSKMRIDVSLRFGQAGATVSQLAGDVIRQYAKAFPFQVRWKDRRPIGSLFLSSVGPHPSHNPRGWFNNAADVDVTTEEGRQRFRERLLKYADDSIKILKQMNAQGMIVWDPEGQELNHLAYYGDPRMTDQFAPETHYRGAGAMGCLDEFFEKFRDAGLRVGVCIRPQQISFGASTPQQNEGSDPIPTLKSKIAFARKRWGCTLFYVDSTVWYQRPMDADAFQQLGAAFPDSLLMPENETLRDFAYSAPLNSFQHHQVTSTPPGARTVYPNAFSVLLAGEGDLTAHRAELVAAVRRGDILIFHGWWPNPNNAGIKSIYDEARKR